MSGLAQLATYVRDLGASRARMIENALDWEHLPPLHDDSFSGIEVIDHDATGWSADARLVDGRSVTLDLRLTPEGWITRTTMAGAVASEIRTTAVATGPDACRVTVEFHVAGLPAHKAAAAGDYYLRLYARLYDEDERMMIARADALRRGPAARLARREVVLADGTTCAVPLYCPHMALPLDAEPDGQGILTCPWHGYRFDARTGACVEGRCAGWTGPAQAPSA